MSQVIHVCIVGNDPISVLTPIIDTSIPSDHVVLAFREHDRAAFNIVKRVAGSRGYKVTEWQLPDSHDTAEASFSFQTLFDRFCDGTATVWFNASTGSRHQVLAAVEVARAYAVDIYVIEPALDKLFWLSPMDRPSVPVKDKLTLKEFFQLYGCRVESSHNQGLPHEYEQVVYEWAARGNLLKDGLSSLNYLATRASGSNFESPVLNARMHKNQALQYLIGTLEQVGLVTYHNNALQFLTTETQRFANGAWLEYLVFAQLRELKKTLPALQDIGHGIEVSRTINGQKVQNELDGLALHNNTLHIIEVKTRRFDRTEANKTLYKLSSLSDRLGGLKSHCALISYYPLRHSELARAHDLGIQVIADGAIRHLKQALQQWMEQQ
ncbi:Card1-like endonuclease domain-containing protein [Alteromonas gilva]|uniref:DUF1887 family CARF protein n=1 Tax=Alteromonas gilva TaxID=2987522 RepID=A0ABT5L5A9_9ALTE|nr:DUF1887 family CARF protein [Alteromonas gilva]MDC8832063.1 DUF1887 family CARF protein [Alteromonas gilva]